MLYAGREQLTICLAQTIVSNTCVGALCFVIFLLTFQFNETRIRNTQAVGLTCTSQCFIILCLHPFIFSLILIQGKKSLVTLYGRRGTHMVASYWQSPKSLGELADKDAQPPISFATDEAAWRRMSGWGPVRILFLARSHDLANGKEML